MKVLRYVAEGVPRLGTTKQSDFIVDKSWPLLPGPTMSELNTFLPGNCVPILSGLRGGMFVEREEYRTRQKVAKVADTGFERHLSGQNSPSPRT